MNESTTVTVGLDVHASSIRVAAIRADELLDERTLPYDHDAVERLVRRWPRVRCCYEAGPTGFGLYRHLVERGIACAVVAPGLVPQRPGDRVKTDPRDARQLARLHAGGLLEPIHVPSPELEAARDLLRAREDARLERMRARHRLGKLVLRNDRRMPTTSWGITRRRWLSHQRFQFPAQQAAFDDYLQALDLVDARIEALEREVDALAANGPWRELVARLRCLRGVDTLTALGIVVEVGDFNRFDTAEAFMSFVGLVPSERSSGDRRRQGSITKAGNAHVRRLLVESAWHARRRPQVGYELGRRQRGQDAAVIARAWRCQQRLHRRWRRMAARGKPPQKIVVACARELAGFIWAIGSQQPLRAEG
jgi:transposase